MTQDQETLPPHFRWNFRAFFTDYVCFGLAFALFNPSSVLPAFVSQLTDSKPVIGAATAAFQAAWLLPQLPMARLINDKPRKKPYLLIALVGRVLWWVVALALWAGLARHRTAMLAVFFACVALFAGSDGASSVAWFDMLARAIPLKRRGRLIGLAQGTGRLAGVGAGALMALILARLAFPGDYTIIFALAGVALIPSSVALTLIREPPADCAPAQAERGARGGWLRILLADPAFRRLMVCRLLVGMTGMAVPFYVVHAGELRLPQDIIGDFVAAQMLAGVFGSLALGRLSERRGPHHVARVASGAAGLAPLLALAVHLASSRLPGEWLGRIYPLVYMALGLMDAGFMLGFMNYLLEIPPEGMRPAYVGLGNTVMAILTLAPIVGGWLLEATSYPVLLGLTTAIVAVGFLLSLRLKAARRATEVQA